MPTRGRPCLYPLAIALKYNLPLYFGKHCPLHPCAPYCPRYIGSKQCVINCKQRNVAYYRADPERHKALVRRYNARKRAWRDKSRKGWVESRKVMATPEWQFYDRAKRLFKKKFNR